MKDEAPDGGSSSYLPVGLRPSFELGLFFAPKPFSSLKRVQAKWEPARDHVSDSAGKDVFCQSTVASWRCQTVTWSPRLHSKTKMWRGFAHRFLGKAGHASAASLWCMLDW